MFLLKLILVESQHGHFCVYLYYRFLKLSESAREQESLYAWSLEITSTQRAQLPQNAGF